MKKVVHIIPYDGVGGVEAAARSLRDGVYNGMFFKKYYLFDAQLHGGILHRTFSYVSALIFIYREKPDLIISSLWRSCIVAIAIKLIYPQLKLVTFFHSSENVHLFDSLWNRIAAGMSSEIWTDSRTTLEKRFPQLKFVPRKIISFLVLDLSPTGRKKNHPVFIFWGRLNYQKGLNRAIRLFASICKIMPMARYHIIGPDGGAENELKQLSNQLGVDGNIVFHGARAQGEIFEFAATASYYLQCSEVEGMAMSVVEAMQLGLVPVVTAVGEIANYCDDNNSILVEGNDTVMNVLNTLHDDNLYHRLSSNAASYWIGKMKYNESICNACADLLKVST